MIDLVVLILTACGLVAGWYFENPWAVLPVLLLPQMRIIQRAFVDFPMYNRKPWDYLLLHESLVLVASLATYTVKG